MADEMIDVVDENNQPTGKVISKREAHENGAWHRNVHIWIYNPKGEVLIQKRSEKKSTYPGLWDISSAGHVSAGQGFDQAAVREVFEELGLKIRFSQLKKIEIRKIKQDEPAIGYHNHEIVQICLLKLDKDVKGFKLQEEEVESTKFIPLAVFEAEIKDSEKIKKYTPMHDYFIDVIKHIRREMEK